MVDSQNKPILEALSVCPPLPGGCLAKILRPFAELEHRYLVMEVDPERDSDCGKRQCDDRVVTLAKFKLEEGSSALFPGKPPRFQGLGQLKTSPNRDQQQWNQDWDVVSNPLEQIPLVQFQSS